MCDLSLEPLHKHKPIKYNPFTHTKADTKTRFQILPKVFPEAHLLSAGLEAESIQTDPLSGEDECFNRPVCAADGPVIKPMSEVEYLVY